MATTPRRAVPARRDSSNKMQCLDIEILIIRAIVCLISLTGCIWHLTDISGIYFSYETDVNVDFEREGTVQIPGVTICINASLSAREDYITGKHPELLNSSHYESHKYFYLGAKLREMPLDEQLNDATLGYREIFNSCLIMKPIAFEADQDLQEEDYIECARIASIREYITYFKKCFFIASELSPEEENRYKVDHDTTLRDNGFPLFQIRLNNRFLEEPVLFVQPRTTPFLGFMGGQTNGVHLNNTKYSSYTFSYVKTTSSLLPPPFKTQCRDYNEIGFKTLSHCIVSCKAHYFIEHFNGWHPDIPANKEYHYNMQVHYSELKLKENKTLDKMMAERCLKECSKMADCSSEYYTMSAIGQFERDSQRDSPATAQLHSIYIYLPTGLNTRYSHSPRLRLIEYICYFASVFSLWFGFSIIATSTALIKAYQYYSDHKTKQGTMVQLGEVPDLKMRNGN